ncbi:16S rRNA (guanine(966)-N(2))-methyltransferase RsmD [Psittacicella gerlachiana]|uniref:Ribosomal RNA small subunit methyltransferase D n=1 Tax=Psittacicella gerlachiana TaxID=2028574 RepID=A0A3A1YLB9_9GAMM|nr:16S rRNA (guanine(966)-N(2))-methyltransferase RsmD [Psittacicella gerlachiana]RIY38465.1 16S rRNA (guanine(966)-N(2))-methyltransferase RsmD [Psittacicella gerlachiana]
MVRKKSTLHQNANSKGFINLQAGALKGKKLEVITSPGLRPIGARVKDVFFNWIQFEIRDRKVLDLFAGSGALGFEALSRGCRSLQMYEYTKAVYDRLILNYRSLNLTALEKFYGFVPQVTINLADSYQIIKQMSKTKYDLVFVDPPFMQEQELEVLKDLAENNFLEEQSLIFLQLDGAYAHLVDNLDSRFKVSKSKAIGNVLIYLLTYTNTSTKDHLDFKDKYQII